MGSNSEILKVTVVIQITFTCKIPLEYHILKAYVCLFISAKQILSSPVFSSH